MTTHSTVSLPASRLAAGIWASLAMASPLTLASTVTSCDDSAAAATTPGTLRYEVAHAASGATIDFALPPVCNSTVTLQTGAITVAQNDLTITGSAAAQITLTKYAFAPATR